MEKMLKALTSLKGEWGILVCFFILFVFVTAMYAVREDVDQDAARYGLMARHILAGEHFPIFCYGGYAGSPNAYLMAGVFALIGPTNFSVILSSAIASAGFVLLTFKLAKEVYGQTVGLLTLAYLALPPTVLGHWYSRPTSPYPEILFAGAGIMLLGYRLIFSELSQKKRSFSNFLFGLIAGVGLWMSPLILYYILPAGILWFVRRPRKLWKEDLPLLVPAFILGSLPFWLYNIHHSFITIRMIDAHPLAWSQAGGSFREVFSHHLPEFLEVSYKQGLHPLQLSLRYGLSVAYILLLIHTLWARGKKSGGTSRKEIAAPGMTWFLILFLILGIWNYTTTGYRVPKRQRQLLPLYSVIPIFFALGTAKLTERCRPASGVFLFLVFGVHAIGTINCWRDNPARYFRKGHEQLISYLKQRGFSHITADFLDPSAFVISFESGESIIASDGFSSSIIPGYLQKVISADAYACVFRVGRSEWFESGLYNLGASWKKEQVGQYEVYHSFSKDADYEELIPDTWKAVGSGEDNPSLAFDRILTTRWTTRCPQKEGLYFEIDLGGMHRVGKVELVSTVLYDYPRSLRILTSVDGKTWEEALRADSCFPLMVWCGPKPVRHGSSEMGAEFSFPSRKAKLIRIELISESERAYWWGINEIFVYGAISSYHGYESFSADETIKTLKGEDVDKVFTDFWISSCLVERGFPPHRVNTVLTRLDQHNLPDPFQAVKRIAIAEGTGFLLWEGEGSGVVNLLDSYEILHKSRRVGKLELVSILEQPSGIRYTNIAQDNWEAKASPSENDPRFAFDRNLETRWMSGRTQSPGMVFQLDLGKAREVCGVRLNAERERKDQPVSLEILVSVDGEKWEKVRLRSNSYEFVWVRKHLFLSSKRIPEIIYTFSPRSVRYIRLVQKGSDDVHYWSIREMNVYSPLQKAKPGT